MTKVRFKEARERRGLTLEEVAGFVPLRPQVLQAIEEGAHQPHAPVLARLELLLRFPGWWLNGHNDGPPEVVAQLRSGMSDADRLQAEMLRDAIAKRTET